MTLPHFSELVSGLNYSGGKSTSSLPSNHCKRHLEEDAGCPEAFAMKKMELKDLAPSTWLKHAWSSPSSPSESSASSASFSEVERNMKRPRPEPSPADFSNESGQDDATPPFMPSFASRVLPLPGFTGASPQVSSLFEKLKSFPPLSIKDNAGSSRCCCPHLNLRRENHCHCPCDHSRGLSPSAACPRHNPALNCSCPSSHLIHGSATPTTRVGPSCSTAGGSPQNLLLEYALLGMKMLSSVQDYRGRDSVCCESKLQTVPEFVSDDQNRVVPSCEAHHDVLHSDDKASVQTSFDRTSPREHIYQRSARHEEYRRARVFRYLHEVKPKRVLACSKTIRYRCRQKVAQTRSRIGGRFAKEYTPRLPFPESESCRE
eukprot:CAMPEP_0196657588 /NCGR_PEP_ID=MMETSP1086-20130531/24326_1 /TAXON_ID=77921 /ORGANISM="Cyanoptyche  gloeocystis , Strain SAG4.97" /LENGTH=373 /DNA_ID=CAMNT_0041990777 /DNA_START=98 /DNA_END=1219 /DNA_ORIENTATION=-